MTTTAKMPLLHSEYAEFYSRLNLGWELIYPVRDAEDRPFGEMSVPPADREGVVIELRPSNYPGTRSGLPMNVSALKQMGQHWDEILADLEFLRASYLRHHGDPEMTLWHLWRFGIVATALPTFLVRRASNPFPSGAVPPRVAGLFKAAQGLALTTEAMFVSGRPVSEPVSTDEFLEYTEENRIFLNESTPARACSGPPQMVREFVAGTLEGHPGRKAPTTTLGEILGDVDALFAYANSFAIMKLADVLVRSECRAALVRFRDEVRVAGGDERLSSALDAAVAPFENDVSSGASRVPLLSFLLSADEVAANHPLRTDVDVSLEDPRVIEAAAFLRAHGGIQREEVARRVVAEVLRYVVFEQSALTLFRALQSRASEALGRPAPGAMDPDDFAAAVSTNPRVEFTRATKIALRFVGSRVEWLAGGARLELALDE